MVNGNFTNPEMTNFVANLVLLERCEQEELYGQPTHDVSIWLQLLMEELGEAASANKMARAAATVGDRDSYEEARENLRYELVQVGALAMATIEAIIDNRALSGKAV